MRAIIIAIALVGCGPQCASFFAGQHWDTPATPQCGATILPAFEFVFPDATRLSLHADVGDPVVWSCDSIAAHQCATASVGDGGTTFVIDTGRPGQQPITCTTTDARVLDDHSGAPVPEWRSGVLTLQIGTEAGAWAGRGELHSPVPPQMTATCDVSFDTFASGLALCLNRDDAGHCSN